MQLELLFEGTMSYDRPPRRLNLFDGTEGGLYGAGTGRVWGRVNGTLQWSNRPRRRGDGVWIPDITGRIDTDDGVAILFTFPGGYWVVEGRGDCPEGILCSATFVTGAGRYSWLNCALGVVEGTMDIPTGAVSWRAYACRSEQPVGVAEPE